MKAKKYVSLLMLAIFFTAGYVFAQVENVLQLIPYNATPESFLVAQIRADTTANGGIPEGRVYELEGGKIYLNTEQFYVAADYTLHLRSSNDQKPIIYQYPSGAGDNPQQPPGYLFRTRGGDIILENLAITSYYEPGDDPAADDFEYFYNVQGGLLRTDGEGASIIMKGCIFSNTSGQVLRTNAATQVVLAQDCIFANLGALSTSNFGAGKGIDLREVSCDSLILINNTFVNYQDRAVRHYNFSSPLEGTGAIYYGNIDHNTFVNGMGFHGLLSLGSVGYEMKINNNLFVDAFAAGEDPTDSTRTKEWANTGETYDDEFGYNKMSWIFAAPNDSTVWVAENNYYAVTAEGQAFFDTYEEITVGDPFSGYVMDALGASAADAMVQIDDPQFANVPDLMIGLMTYYVVDANKTKDTPNSEWDPQTQDMDRRPIQYYINDFDVAYSTSSTAYTGASGFPAGDLNAFPDKKAEWELTSIEREDGVLAKEFTLAQNYPNPFNPTTTIKFAIPSRSNVTLKVFNMLGQEVALLVNKEMGAGSYVVNFDAGNLSSGIYFYSIQADQFSVTKKMMLLK